MTLILTIENVSALPDGGPLGISLTGRRGIDIGRDQYLDWTLPDPDRVISGKHAEIRHKDGGYWLYDVSRNGVFVNRNPQRLQEAHRLRDGDRIEIGHYVIVARIEGETPSAPPQGNVDRTSPAVGQDCWDLPGETPPIPRRHLKASESLRPVRPDFSDWLVDMPGPIEVPRINSAPPGDEQDWTRPVAAPLPTPRRPPEAVPLPPLASPPPFPTPDFGASPYESPPAPISSPPPPALPLDHPWDAPVAGQNAQLQNQIPPEPAAPSKPASDADAFIRRFAAGLGIPPEILAWQDPADLAEEAGALLRLSAENVKQLLAARTESKRVAKAANQTTVQALDNNPLKFSPTVDDALRIMLGRPSTGYLGARRAMEESFRDLKTHQIKTYAAMQNALRLLTDELSPEGIEASDEKDRGLSGLLGSRKARLWDIYTTRWDALASLHDDGMVDAFLVFFADCYDKSR